MAILSYTPQEFLFSCILGECFWSLHFHPIYPEAQKTQFHNKNTSTIHTTIESGNWPACIVVTPLRLITWKQRLNAFFCTCDSITIKPQNSKDPVKSVRTVLLCNLPPSDGFLRKCQRANEWEWNNLRTTHGVYFLDVLFPENLFKWFHVLFLYKEIHFCNFVLEVLRNDTFRNKFCFIFFIRLMLLWERWHFRNCWKGTVCFTANYKSRNL